MTDEQLTSLPRHKLAMLIDGDNAQAGLLSQMLVEAGRYGQVTVRRIYGDWTTPNMNSWKETLNFHAFQPIQQFRYTIGKNATDSAMIIDAMDILHSGVVDGFCLVSSDSDYTRLATRIRETGIFVMGIGEKKTPKPFVNACDVFCLHRKPGAPKRKRPRTPPAAGRPAAKPEERRGTQGPKAEARTEAEARTTDPDPLPILEQAYEMAVRDDGWARLDVMGTNLYQLDPASTRAPTGKSSFHAWCAA